MFFANDRDPALPSRIAPAVQAVLGLSNVAQPRPSNGLFALILGLLPAIRIVAVAIAAIVFLGAILDYLYRKIFSGTKFRGYYNGSNTGGPDPTCGWKGIDGTGQTIGLVEFDTFAASDVADYLALIGAPATMLAHVSSVHISGGATPGPNQNEVLLDIDNILSTAPGAKIVTYDAPFANGKSFQPILNKMINDRVTIISNSWSYCEDQAVKADVDSIDALFKTAAASGISVFNAAGDTGGTCLDGSANTVGVPADSPNATAVGGTSLTPGTTLTY